MPGIKLAVIGSPVSHSLSPVIHGRFARACGIDIEYQKLEVTRGTLGDFIARAGEEGFRGFNVTMPLKEAVIPYLAELDGIARECGAVNTVVLREGGLYGCNTDGLGVARTLKNALPELRGKSALILGGGGASKAAAAALRRVGVSVALLTREKGGESLPWDKLTRLAETSDIIINATPLGMDRGAGTVEFPGFSWLDALKPGAAVFDAVYKPRETLLLAAARRRGLAALGGLGMLIYQAEEAFRLFTGKTPPADAAPLVKEDLREWTN
ncbi:MAG: shikimate dehydrogenase [Oscillospiraceae bacterium]|jgi:shikimate dehydrogenase|nr:shikimate dehydrogenase [Oscillospiraceae bacterium]